MIWLVVVWGLSTGNLGSLGSLGSLGIDKKGGEV